MRTKLIEAPEHDRVAADAIAPGNRPADDRVPPFDGRPRLRLHDSHAEGQLHRRAAVHAWCNTASQTKPTAAPIRAIA